jgi:hypothetical protein
MASKVDVYIIQIKYLEIKTAACDKLYGEILSFFKEIRGSRRY